MSRARPGQQHEPPSTIAAPPLSIGSGGPPPIAGMPRKVLPGAQVLRDGTNVETLNPSQQVEGYDVDALRNTDNYVAPRMAMPVVGGPNGFFAEGVRTSPPVKRWVVLEEFDAGNLGKIRRGKVLDESNYNIDRIAAAGARIEIIPPGYQAADVLLGRVPPEAFQAAIQPPAAPPAPESTVTAS